MKNVFKNAVCVCKLGFSEHPSCKIPYVDIFGGVTAFSKDTFSKINGFSNDAVF